MAISSQLAHPPWLTLLALFPPFLDRLNPHRLPAAVVEANHEFLSRLHRPFLIGEPVQGGEAAQLLIDEWQQFVSGF